MFQEILPLLPYFLPFPEKRGAKIKGILLNPKTSLKNYRNFTEKKELILAPTYRMFVTLFYNPK
ncbi:MAG: hypothetical protein ACK40G_16390 [Cytophagaceae bacterium]